MHTYNFKSNGKSSIAEIKVASPANWNLSRSVFVNVLSILTLLAIYVLTVSAVRFGMAMFLSVFAGR